MDRTRRFEVPALPPGRPEGFPLPVGGADEGGLIVGEIVGLVRRRAVLVVVAVAICLAGSAVLTMREAPRYRATAVIRVGEAREAITQGIETPTGMANRHVNPLLSRTEALRSRSLLGAVVDSVGFRLHVDHGAFGASRLSSVRVPHDADPDTVWLEFRPDGFSIRTLDEHALGTYGRPASIAGIVFTLEGVPDRREMIWVVLPRQVAIDRLMNGLRVSPRDETNIVDVAFDSSDPARAQEVVNTLVAAYREFDAQFAQERASRRRLFLEEQLAETDAMLAQAQGALSAFRTRARTFDAGQELAAQQQNRLTLDIRRGELDTDRRMLHALLDRLDSSAGEERGEVLRTLASSPGVAENPAVSRIHEQLLRERVGLDSLTVGAFGSAGTNPDVQRQRDLIETAEGELTSAIRSHVASLDARVGALDDLAARTDREMASLPSQLAEEARLAQIAQTYRKMGDQLREEYQKARMAEAVVVGEADILDLAVLPYEPLPDNRAIKLAMGLLLGLGLGIGVAFVLENRNGSIRTVEELEQKFQLPVLAVIPHAGGPELTDPGGTRSGKGSTNGSGVALTKPIRPLANHADEAYRMLRTNYLFAGWTRNVRSVAVTSTAPQEGKTLTSVNLAASIAEEGARVLLVDADLWRGRLHTFFGIPQSPGLGEVLRGTHGAGEAISRNTNVPGLWVLPRGESNGNPSSLTRGMALRAVFEKLGQRFDVLVVDGPPVLAAGSAPVTAAVADGVILLVRAGSTQREAMRETLRQLDTVGARVLGAVLNDPDNVTTAGRRSRYRYYEYASTRT
jgi:tyrosine-protein kinase Etk/Wzc